MPSWLQQLRSILTLAEAEEQAAANQPPAAVTSPAPVPAASVSTTPAAQVPPAPASATAATPPAESRPGGANRPHLPRLPRRRCPPPRNQRHGGAAGAGKS